MARIIRPVRVSTKGQMIIPVEVRQKLSIKPADQLVIVSGDSEAIIMKPKRYAESLRGAGKGLYGKTRKEIDAYVQGERAAWK